ncbi:alginate export family protein [Mucilaginibacter arboris]|nr:alginate export family protein [Mucilaginibacter arboris]
MNKNLLLFAVFIMLILNCLQSSAQISLIGQLRPRAEYRDGYGTLEPETSKPAGFVSQRVRLIFNYKSSRVIFQTSIQDVRIWGQDASSISNADGNKLFVHEAWAELVLANKKDTSFKKPPVDYLGLKIGRQEIVYDDSRLLGNFDWQQQGRRHDAVVLKMLNKGWQVDLGAAYNQNTDAVNYNGTYYTPANVPATIKDSNGNLVNTPAGIIPLVNAAGISSKTGTPSFSNPPGSNAATQDYKTFQYLYAAKTFHQTKISGLFFADQFGKYVLDSVRNVSGSNIGYVYGRRFNQTGLNTRYTTGLMLVSPLGDKSPLSFSGAFYYQGGHDRDGLSLSAYTSTLALTFQQKLFGFTPGWDYLSGNDAFSTSTTNHRFDPLYGTPHKFWGFMDYFYAGTGSPAGGLNDAYFKIKYLSINKRFNAGLDYHYFALAQEQKDVSGNAIKKFLGSEFDFIGSYNLSKYTTVEAGVAMMAATRSMEYAKNVTPGSSHLNNAWSYLQINIRPDFFSK